MYMYFKLFLSSPGLGSYITTLSYSGSYHGYPIRTKKYRSGKGPSKEHLS